MKPKVLNTATGEDKSSRWRENSHRLTFFLSHHFSAFSCLCALLLARRSTLPRSEEQSDGFCEKNPRLLWSTTKLLLPHLLHCLEKKLSTRVWPHTRELSQQQRRRQRRRWRQRVRCTCSCLISDTSAAPECMCLLSVAALLSPLSGMRLHY